MGKEGDIDIRIENERRFRELLKEYREAAGVSRKELARRIEHSAVYIKKLELGIRRPPPLRFLRLMVEKLELDEKKADALFEAAEYRPLSAIKRNEEMLEQMQCHGFERPQEPTDDFLLSSN